MPFPSSSYIPKYSKDPLYNSIKTPCFRVTVILTCTFRISYNLKLLSLSGYRLRTYKHTELWLLWPIISSTCRQTTVQLGTFRNWKNTSLLPLGMGSIFGPNLRAVTALYLYVPSPHFLIRCLLCGKACSFTPPPNLHPQGM